MAELEIHHEGGHGSDPVGKKVGVLAATFAVLLAVVTILSHRAHTDSVMKKSDENDKWGYYQSKKIKLHNAELGLTVIETLGAKDDPKTKEALQKFEKEKEKYTEESKEIEKQANEIKEEVEHIEKKAVRYDLGEGLLEIALVMSSLYFIAKKTLFPIVGVLGGIAGVVLAIMGLLI